MRIKRNCCVARAHRGERRSSYRLYKEYFPLVTRLSAVISTLHDCLESLESRSISLANHTLKPIHIVLSLWFVLSRYTEIVENNLMLRLASSAVSEHRKYALMNEIPLQYAPLPMLPHPMHSTK